MKNILLTILNWLKPFAAALIIIIVLQLTGLLTGFTTLTQSALLMTGVRDVDDEPLKKNEQFDYNFTFQTLDGKKVNGNDLKGKVVFLNLWATWCGPCRAEMPSIQGLYDKMKDSGIVFVSLSIDKDSDLPKVLKYVEKNNYTFPVYKPSGTLTSQLDVPSIPTTFIVDKNGMVVKQEVGASNFNTPRFKKFLESLLAK